MITIELSYEQAGFLLSLLQDTIGEKDARHSKVQEIINRIQFALQDYFVRKRNAK